MRVGSAAGLVVATGGLSSGVVDHVASGGDVVRASGADHVKGCADGGVDNLDGFDNGGGSLDGRG